MDKSNALAFDTPHKLKTHINVSHTVPAAVAFDSLPRTKRPPRFGLAY